MSPQDLDLILQQSIDNSIAQPASMNNLHIINWLVKAGLNLYPWWSPSRDTQLRALWKQSDHLSGAVYTICAKMTSIPMRVQARDQNIKEHVKQAEDITFNLNAGAEWGKGWPVFFDMFVQELVSTDNGAFAEVIGAGDPSGPIIGSPITVRMLDSVNCQRTGDPVYPVIYRDPMGKLFKLHYTRVIYASQMPSAIAEMLNVGFCAVSRAIGVAQNLIDILTYKSEKLGSRPHRGVIVTQGGLDPEDVRNAFASIAHDMDSQALSRYSKIAVVGSASLPDARLEMTDMAGLPDNFDERTSVELGMATIALAFGMDARELFPSLSAGATRADALIQHLKQRGKGPGQIIQQTELMFNSKYLPPHLELVFDFQDDEQDRQAAETKELRARRWATAQKSLAMDTRTVREQMLEVGDLTAGQFEELELADGRLPDGTSVLALFYSKDKNIKKLLDLGQEVDPLDIEESNSEMVMAAIKEKKAQAQEIIVNSTSPDERRTAKRAMAALEQLEKEYTGEDEMQPEVTDGAPGVENGDLTQPDPRVRKVDLKRPKPDKIESDELKPDEDDGEIKEAGSETASPFDVDFSLVLKTIDSYRMNLRAAVRGLWSGSLNYLWFYEQMQSAINRGLGQAWTEGLAMAGILPDEASDAEKQMLTREIINERMYIEGLASYIEEHSRAKKGKLTPLYNRVEMWVNGYTRVMNLANVMASGDKKKRWNLHPAEHCGSCRKLDGKVKRASYWTANGIYPKAWDKLNCRGGCKCTLDDTDEPLSKGPLPGLP